MKSIFKSFTLIAIIIIATTKSYSQQCTTCAGTTVSGVTPSAIGTNTKATGDYSFAAGYGSEAPKQTAIALGHFAKANGIRSIAIGENCVSNSQGYSFGQNAKALGSQSLAIGRFVETDVNLGINSIVLGSSSDQYILKNNIANSLMVGFNSTIPTLFVGPSPNYTSVGKIGIGTTAPAANLHILSNNNENALFYLQNKQFAAGSFAQFQLGNSLHGLKATPEDGLIFKTGKNYIFNEGYVGIGTTNPQSALHVNGDVLFSSLARPDGGVLGFDSRGMLLPVDITELGDNLGSHIATKDLNMARFNIINGEDIESNTMHNHITYSGQIIGDSKNKDWGKLEIFGSQSPDAAMIEIGVGQSGKQSLTFITHTPDAGIEFLTNGIWAMTVKPTYVSIGDVYHEAEEPVDLRVYGRVYCREVEVTLRQWYDNVFEKEYNLMPLNELDTYITANKHLPEIPTNEEVLSNGVNVGEMNALLLKKVEELTLYVIELKKENDLLKQRFDNSGL